MSKYEEVTIRTSEINNHHVTKCFSACKERCLLTSRILDRYLHQVAVLGGKVDPLLALTLAVLGVVLDDPLDGLADETGATSDEDNRLGRRHVVM